MSIREPACENLAPQLEENVLPAFADGIRPAQPADLPSIVETHATAFPLFFSTQLGEGFLHAYYARILHYDHGVLLLAEEAGRLVGFVAGFLDPSAFYRALYAQKWSLARLLIGRTLRQPWLAGRVLAGGLRVHALQGGLAFGARLLRRALRIQSLQVEYARTDGWPCELSSVAVAFAQRSQGWGQRLVQAFLATVRQRGATEVYLTTDAKDNDQVHRFYQRLGFQRVRDLRSSAGREMSVYVFWPGEERPLQPEPGGSNHGLR